MSGDRRPPGVDDGWDRELGGHDPFDEVPDSDERRDPRADRGERLIPRTVKVVLGTVLAELMLLVFAVAFLTSTLLQDAEADARLTVATMASAVIVIVTLLAGGLAVLRGRRWGRTPLVTWQVMQVGVALPTFNSQAWPLGVLLVVLSVIGIVALASPGVRRHVHWRELTPGS